MWLLWVVGYLLAGIPVARFTYLAASKNRETEGERHLIGTATWALWPFAIVVIALTSVYRVTIGRPTPQERAVAERKQAAELERLHDRLSAEVRRWEPHDNHWR